MDVSDKERKDKGITIRRIYFTNILFLLLFVLPETDNIDILFKIDGVFGLSRAASNMFIMVVSSVLIYFLIVSGFHIAEISFGSAKINMIKENISKELTEQDNVTNALLEKIVAENKLLQNMNEYCNAVMERVNQDEEIIFPQEYRLLLERYFNLQSDNVGVLVVTELGRDSVREDFKLKSAEYTELVYTLSHNEAYTVKKENTYYLFIPYTYMLEGFERNIYIILASEKPLANEAERTIIPSLLIQFTDELLMIVRG